NGFVVLSGSYGKNNETNSMLSGYKRLKRELINEGVIKIKDDKLIFEKIIYFLLLQHQLRYFYNIVLADLKHGII
ncbi:MAG: hypothetical protein PHO80_04590, partial [Candidatus Gracilibacteria bacterium]|nr:hypothetical protein [Candidatus Gracilibacteria bacterium]